VHMVTKVFNSKEYRPKNKTEVIRIVQITDLHLFADKQQDLLGIKTWDSFQAVVDAMQPDIVDADFILVTGDVSQDQSKASYALACSVLDKLGKPVHILPGNHDVPQVMRAAMATQFIGVENFLDFGSWHILLLDSSIPHQVSGHIDTTQLEQLKAHLAAYPDKFHLICLHHHPIEIQSHWLDAHRLKEGALFLDELAQFKQVKSVLFGHIHQEFHARYAHFDLWATPATSVQFKPKAYDFTVDDVQPGYRIIELSAEGQISTSVKRIPDNRFQAVQAESGY